MGPSQRCSCTYSECLPQNFVSIRLCLASLRHNLQSITLLNLKEVNNFSRQKTLIMDVRLGETGLLSGDLAAALVSGAGLTEGSHRLRSFVCSPIGVGDGSQMAPKR